MTARQSCTPLPEGVWWDLTGKWVLHCMRAFEVNYAAEQRPYSPNQWKEDSHVAQVPGAS